MQLFFSKYENIYEILLDNIIVLRIFVLLSDRQMKRKELSWCKKGRFLCFYVFF